MEIKKIVDKYQYQNCIIIILYLLILNMKKNNEIFFKFTKIINEKRSIKYYIFINEKLYSYSSS